MGLHIGIARETNSIDAVAWNSLLATLLIVGDFALLISENPKQFIGLLL